MNLRWLARGPYLDKTLAYSVSVSTFFYMLDETICSLDAARSLEFLFNDTEYLERINEMFTRGRSPISGCAGCIDGIAIKIIEPCFEQLQLHLHISTEKKSLLLMFRLSATILTSTRLDM
jgi:hypothetical protein